MQNNIIKTSKIQPIFSLPSVLKKFSLLKKSLARTTKRLQTTFKLFNNKYIKILYVAHCQNIQVAVTAHQQTEKEISELPHCALYYSQFLNQKKTKLKICNLLKAISNEDKSKTTQAQHAYHHCPERNNQASTQIISRIILKKKNVYSHILWLNASRCREPKPLSCTSMEIDTF